jgi:ATP-dependent Clp protease adapter protein ClpS
MRNVFSTRRAARYNRAMPDDTPTQRPEDSWYPESTFGEDLTAMAPKMGIVFHDDDKTPVDFVMFLLETYLGYDEQGARNLVGSIATGGQYQVSTLTRAAAEALYQRLQRAVDHAGYPFKITLVHVA